MNTLLKTLFIAIFFLGTRVLAQMENTAFSHTLESHKKPWTNKPFYNDPKNFQFAIVSDRTGGHRQGVFGKGLEKINLLYPEFVMSVGDLIEGYSKNNSLLNKQWSEFNGMLDSLKTKFFYVAGNHDFSNEVMAKQWKEHYGADYYHFKYKDVLFLILNSNDGDGVLMGKDQIEFAKEAIAQNTDVRWTMVFVHHPMWVYGDANGFNEIESALKDRDYTVFAGHTHRYMHEVRNDQNHYVLATTGGGSRLRGPKFGEFDEVGWVTMTDAGPKLVNLALSGIIKDNVSNLETKKQAIALIKGTDFKPLVLAKGKKRKVILSLNNTSDKTIHFKGQVYHHHQVELDSSRFELSLAPQSSNLLTLMTKPSVKMPESAWDPLELAWEMGYDNAFMEPEFSLSGTETIELKPSEPHVSITVQNIFIKDLKVSLDHPYKNMEAKYTLNTAVPDINAPKFPESVNLKQTSTIKVIIEDKEGFQSDVFQKKYIQKKPASASKPKHLKKGIAYSYYEGHFTSVPKFENMTPIKTGIAHELTPDKIGQRLDHYAIQYTGYINIPKTGIYTFYLKSDDGANFFINDTLVIDNDGSHSTSQKKELTALKKGWHPIRIDYFEDFLEEELELYHSSAELEKSPVTFWH